MYIIICNKFMKVSLLQMKRHYGEIGRHNGFKLH